MLPQLPKQATKIIQTIAAAGGHAYVVGGALRDLLLAKTPHDWDFAATLPVADLLSIFAGARLVGGVCGTVQVPFAGGTCEITPCRKERGYSDKRHPDEVVFSTDILQDLARRDFTINAMAYDGETLLDPFEGRQDLSAGVLRCVGGPTLRFAEDPLRILRLFRFEGTLGFAPHPLTLVAAVAAMPNLATLSAERVRAEVEQILLSPMPQVLQPVAENGGLRRYGLVAVSQAGFAPLAQTPPTLLCRWWGLLALCNAPPQTVGQAFGFARRFVKDLAECNRLFALGPAQNRVELKMKLRASLLPYAEVLAAFTALNPAFAGERPLYEELQANREPYRLAHLAVDGEMLAHEGIHGKKCGRILEELLKVVICNPEMNRGPALMGIAKGLKGLL